MIASIEEMPAESEEEEMPVEADVTPEVEVKQPKKVVSITEQHFAEMQAKIEELETKLSAMTTEVIEEQPTDVIEFSAEPKPIQFNPENVQPMERVDLAINTPKSLRDRILEEVYNNK
jgi:TolA-binding protein